MYKITMIIDGKEEDLVHITVHGIPHTEKSYNKLMYDLGMTEEVKKRKPMQIQTQKVAWALVAALNKTDRKYYNVRKIK